MIQERIKLKDAQREIAEKALKDYMAQGGEIQTIPTGVQTLPANRSRKETNRAQWGRRVEREQNN